MLRLRWLLTAVALLGCLPAAVKSADLPLYVHFLPFNPPDLFMRTTRVGQAFFNPTQTSGNTVNYTFDVTATTSLAPGPIPISLTVFSGNGNTDCEGTKAVLLSLDIISGGTTTNVGSETQTVTVNATPFVTMLDFNGISLASPTVLNAGDTVRMQITNTTPGPGIFCLVNEFPLDGTDTDASRIVLQTGPLLTLNRTLTVLNDPVNGTVNPKAIPGALVRYTLEVSNDSSASEPADNAIITDEIPAGTTYTFGDNLILVDGVPQTDDSDAPTDSTDFGVTAANSITTNLGTIAIGATRTMTYDVTIN